MVRRTAITNYFCTGNSFSLVALASLAFSVVTIAAVLLILACVLRRRFKTSQQVVQVNIDSSTVLSRQQDI